VSLQGEGVNIVEGSDLPCAAWLIETQGWVVSNYFHVPFQKKKKEKTSLNTAEHSFLHTADYQRM
jgi:hypothetical protein